MARNPTYETRELSKDTWPDLERLFQKPGIGDAWWCWCTFHHTASFTNANDKRGRASWAKTNHTQQEELVANGESHGVIVYLKNEPVGWCQYGPREELPRADHSRKYVEPASADKKEKLWRITCFVVDKDQRKRGVASAALKATLESIEKKGGGIVEAFPVSKTDQGPGYMYTGRVSMFKKLGFKISSPFGTGRTSKIVMRKKL